MKFYAECHNAVYVIRPTTRRVEPVTMNITYVPGLSAEFVRHEFDSEAAQIANGWSDEDRKIVENGLLNGKDFGTRLYLQGDRDKTIVNGGGSGLRCVVFTPDEEGGSVQCSEQALAGSNFCREHLETAEVAV